MKLTIFLLTGLVSLAMASTITEPATDAVKEAVPETPVSDAVSAIATTEDMDESASTIDNKQLQTGGDEMEADGTVALPNTAVQENYVGQYSTRTCSTLGTSVVNLNQCCSVSAGPIDSTNIKKCCLPVGSVCNESPNSCCNYKQVSCLETSPGSSILTCQRVDIQVLPSSPAYNNHVNAYGNPSVVVNGVNNGYNNQRIVSTPINYQQQSTILNGLNDASAVQAINNGYANGNPGYGLNLNSGLGNIGAGTNYANNPVTNYAANAVVPGAYGQPNVIVDNGYNNNLGLGLSPVNNVLVNNPNNYGNGASGYGYAAAAAAAGAK